MQYYTSNLGGVPKIHLADSSTGRIVTIWPGAIPSSYNVINEVLSTTPGSGGSNSPYQVYVSFFREVQRDDVLVTLYAAQNYLGTI